MRGSIRGIALFAQDIKGLQDPLDLFTDLQLLSMKVLGVPGPKPRLGKLLIELVDARSQRTVLGHQGFHPLFHFLEFFIKIIQTGSSERYSALRIPKFGNNSVLFP